MDALATPTAAPPVLYGAPAPPGDLLPWSWAEQRAWWRPAPYNPKYDWDAVVTDDQVTDSAGAAGPAYRVRPRVVFGWDADMRAPTRWSFADPTTSVTPLRPNPVPDAGRHQFSGAAWASTSSSAHPSAEGRQQPQHCEVEKPHPRSE
jgi:hypothetical protein